MRVDFKAMVGLMTSTWLMSDNNSQRDKMHIVNLGKYVR